MLMVNNLAGFGAKKASQALDSLPIANRVFGMHMDGANNSTSFPEITGKIPTVVGNSKILTAQYPPVSGKTSSAYFDGSGDYLSFSDSADFDFGSGDFTVRMWFRADAVAAVQALMHRGQWAGFTPWTVFIYNSKVYFEGSITGSSTAWSIISTNSISANTWYYVEASRANGTARLFLGDSLEGSATGVSGSLMDTTTTMKIAVDSSLSTYHYAGYLSELEIYKGAAIDSNVRTTPTAPFADS